MEIKRDLYLNQLIERKQNGLIKVITGIRRCGKSYLLNTLFYDYLKSSGVDENHIIKCVLLLHVVNKRNDRRRCNEYR